jgi:hypothetical protein
MQQQIGWRMKILYLSLLFLASIASQCASARSEIDFDVPAHLLAVDIGNSGPAQVKSLITDEHVLWSAELGTELLVAFAEESASKAFVSHWRNTSGFSSREISIRARRSEIVLESLSCGRDHDHFAPSIVAIVGGFGIRKLSGESVLMALLGDPSLRALPAMAQATAHSRHVVLAQTVANLEHEIAAAGIRSNVSELVAGVKPDRWFEAMSGLANFNRNGYNPMLLNARDWIRDRFVESGLAATDHIYSMTNSNTFCTTTMPVLSLPNVIGRKHGLIDEWIVVGAHFDSRNTTRCDVSANPQPGANDNASGCAGVIELARVFQNSTTRRGILFMCFSGEEQNLRGSVNYVNSLVSNGEISKIKGMINLDMIGHDMDGSLPTRIDTRTAHSLLAQQFAAAAASYAPELRTIISLDNDPFTDHLPFLNASIPAVHTWENGASGYAAYHTVNDIPSAMTRPREMAGGILKMDAAVLADLAQLIDSSLFKDGFE